MSTSTAVAVRPTTAEPLTGLDALILAAAGIEEVAIALACNDALGLALALECLAMVFPYVCENCQGDGCFVCEREWEWEAQLM